MRVLRIVLRALRRGVVALVVAALCLVGVATASAAADAPSGRPDAAWAPADPVALVTPLPEGATCAGAIVLLTGCWVADGPIRPALEDLATDAGEGFSCYRTRTARFASCEYGSEAEDAPRVALIGDSHAAMYSPALREVADENGWALTTFVGNGCVWRPMDGDACTEMGAIAQERFTDPDAPFDLIVATGTRRVSQHFDAAFRDEVAAYWQEAIDVGTRVVVIADGPLGSEESVACVMASDPDAWSTAAGCGVTAAEGYLADDALIDVARRLDGAAVLETEDLFCVDGWCPSVIGGVVAFRDPGSHLTATYGDTLAPVLRDRLTELAELPTPGRDAD